MNENPHLRLGVLGLVIVALFASLFARLWYLQILAGDQFKLAASANAERVILEEAPRGRIFDRNGKLLVDNRQSIVLTVDRQKLPKPGSQARTDLLTKVATELSRYTGQPRTVDDIEKRLADVRYSPYTPVPVGDDVPKELELYVDEHRDEFGDAVAVSATTIRSYPLGRTAAHVLGYVGSITQDELDSHKESPKTYSLGDDIGKTGVERTYEDFLRGVPAKRVLEVDAKGKTIRQLSYTPAVPGDDLVLTLDANVQATTEQALKEELANAKHRRNNDGSYNTSPAGSAVVLDPNTGQVIAMASYPDFDPSEFTKPIPNDRWQQLNDPSGPDGEYPLNNRAIQGEYAPGSTFKLITATAALQNGLITPESTIVDSGSFRIPDCVGGDACIRRNSGGTAHGRIALPSALTVSSDVYFYTLGARFWTGRAQYGDAIQKTAQAFGLGAETGIPLPGELGGFVPTPENKKARHEQNPGAFPYGDWYTGDNVNLAIGQGDMVATPLQLANAYAAMANGGTVYSPNVALEIHVSSTPQVRQQIAPRQLSTINIPPDQRAAIMQGLEGVTANASGTAYGAFKGFPAGWPVAGKTGTAQVTNGSDNALFVGIGPATAPQYVGIAVLEHSGFGAVAAAPVVRRVFEGLADPTLQPTVGPGGVLDKPVPAPVDNGASAVRD